MNAMSIDAATRKATKGPAYLISLFTRGAAADLHSASEQSLGAEGKKKHKKHQHQQAAQECPPPPVDLCPTEVQPCIDGVTAACGGDTVACAGALACCSRFSTCDVGGFFTCLFAAV